MSLFVVERYLGDEANTNIKDNEGHLAKLISKVEQRKQIKNIADHIINQNLEKSSSNTSVDTRCISIKHKKRKRNKDLKVIEQTDDILESVDDNNEDEYKTHVPSIMKKKRRKEENLGGGMDVHCDTVTSARENEDDEILLQTKESVEKKQRKKKREISKPSPQENDDIEIFNSTELSQMSNFEEDSEINDTIKSSEEQNSNFTIIGDHSFNKNKEVKRILPQWLAKPSVISVDLKHLKDDINSIPYLDQSLVNKLQENGITHFFPVQSQLIPFLLKSERIRSANVWPVDVCVSAPTGSGKTLAFVLPIIQTLLYSLVTKLRVVVVLPVQDLAAQVAGVFRKFVKGTGLSVYLTVGGTPLHEEQLHLVKQRVDGTFVSLVDILVTTPGRLVDHIYSTRGFTVKHLRYIVIDEADRVMDNFQNDWLYHLDNHLNMPGCPPLTVANLQGMPLRPQKLLFSATLSSDPEKLSELSLFQPHLFTSVVSSSKKEVNDSKFIGKYTTPAELKEYMVLCGKTVKPLVLFKLIIRERWKNILVFASTTQNVHNLATLLHIFGQKTQHFVNVAEINATMPRLKRQQLIGSFTAGEIDVLVSTDSLARGIDIPGVRYVINYDIPKFIKSYIHRVGRTGRAGQEGTAVSLLSHEQTELFTNLLKTAGKHEDISQLTVDEEELKEFEDVYKEALQSLKQLSETQLKNQQQEKIMKNKMVIGKVRNIYANVQKKKRKNTEKQQRKLNRKRS